MQQLSNFRYKLFVLLLACVFALPRMSHAQPYSISGYTCVFPDYNYGPYSINGGPWNFSDKWCVTNGLISGINVACTNGSINPSIGVVWNWPGAPGNVTGAVTFYHPSTTLVATLNVTVMNPGSGSPGAQFVPMGVPVSFTMSAPDVVPCNGGTVFYQWVMSTNGGSSYTNVPGATSSSYNIVNQAFNTQTVYRRVVTASNTIGSAMSTPTSVIPMSPPAPGSVSPSVQLVYPGQTPVPLTISGTSGGSCGGNYTYFWETSTDNVNFTPVAVPPSATYQPPVLYQPTYYRVRIGCGPLQSGVYSNTALVWVILPMQPGTISPASVNIPYNTAPGPINSTPATGGNCPGTYAYQWQESTDAQNFTDILGATSVGYTPGVHTATKYYRRSALCAGQTLYTNTFQVKVIDAADNYNYVRERLIKRGGVTDLHVAEGLSSLRDVVQTTNYQDWLGRHMQTVMKKGSLNTNPADPTSSAAATDRVSVSVYDQVGRTSTTYLSYPSPGTDGIFKTSALTEQHFFFNNHFATQGESHFFGQVKYEASPLGRPEEVFAAGVSWAGSAGNPSESSRRSIKTKNLSNTEPDAVRIWNFTAPVSTGSFGSYNSPGTFAAGTLYKTITTDELGRQIIEFRDREKKLILKKAQVTAAEDNGSGSDHPGWHCTYYIYDAIGNIRCVITPRAVELIYPGWLLTDATILAEQCFRYEYDIFNRKIMQKDPGAGEEYMVYDYRDRLVMTQDANLRAGSPAKWMVTLFDKFDRPVQTGLWNDANSLLYHVGQAINTAAADYPFGESSIPGSGYERLTRTGYDTYNSLPGGSGLTTVFDNTYTGNSNYFYTSYNNAPGYAQPITPTAQVRGMVTWTETKILNSATYLYTIQFYDEYGRIVQVKKKNITGGTDIITTQYNWAGQVLKTLNQFEKAGSPVQTSLVLSQLIYDDMSRVIRVEKKVQSTLVNSNQLPGVWTTVSKSEYNALGQVKIKRIGDKKDPATGSYTGVPLEVQSFEYNIRGWLLGMNRAFVGSQGQSGTNRFGYDLGYDKPGNISGQNFIHTPQLNGNITGVVWKSDGSDVRRKYDFKYDETGRMLRADYIQQNRDDNQWNVSQMNYTVQMGDGATAASAYDANGNIKSMTQYGYKPGGNAASPIDQLTYNYMFDNTSNRLLNVIDNANLPDTKLGDFRTSILHTQVKNVNTVDYTYDNNGNMVKDLNKDLEGYNGVNGLTYNYLNLVEQATVKKDAVSNKGTITYTYDATGMKQRKVVQELNVSVSHNGTNYVSNITTTITYVTGFVYETKVYSDGTLNAALGYSDRLQFLFHEEGRVRFDPITTKLIYDYFIRDNIGNIRMVLTEDNGPAAIYQATIEDANRSNEIKLFTLIPETESLKPGGFDSDAGNLKVTRLFNVSGTDKRVGTGIVLKVMAGDKYKVLTKGWYLPNGTDFNPLPGAPAVLGAVVSAFAGAVPAGSKYTGPELAGSGVLSGPLTSFLNYQNGINDPNRPKAYLNWMILDEEQLKLVSGSYGAVQVPQITGSNPYQVMQAMSGAEIEAQVNGYLYVYVSNESQGNVYFDDLRIEHIRGALVEENHYYPAGLAMNAISSRQLADGYVGNQYRYQGQEYEQRLGLEALEFEARMYDPQLGMWHSPDPANQFASPYTGMGNSWPNVVDADGRLGFFAVFFIAVSAFMEGMQADMQGKSFLGGFFKGALIGGASAAITGGLDKIASFKDLGLVGGGMLKGAIGGVATGALGAAVNGKNILKGAIKDGLIGAAIGGVEGLITRLSLKPHAVALPEGAEADATKYFATQQELEDYIATTIGDVNRMESELCTDFTLATGTNLPQGFLYHIPSKMIVQQTSATTGMAVGAMTNFQQGSGYFCSLKSQIFVSPGVKGVVDNGVKAAHYVISHEIIHAYHFKNQFVAVNKFLNQTEASAYTYNLAYAKAYNMPGIADHARKMIQHHGGKYEYAMSWRRLVAEKPYINIGIKPFVAWTP